MRKYGWNYLLCLIVCFVSFVPTSNAVVLDEALDRHWVKESELIVVGKISDINYASSSKETEEDAVLPHTFITVAIEQTLKGTAADQRQIILRFQGGMGEEEGSWLEIMGIPRFDIGDYGVFFIKGNESHICPLVGWRQGFMRIIDDQIISDFGNNLILVDDPILSARIHPKDIRNFDNFKARLLKPQTGFESGLINLLSKETVELLRSPDSLNELDPNLLKYTSSNFDIQSEEGLQDILPKLLPMEFRQIPRSFAEAMLVRDLNFLLLNRAFVTNIDISDLELSEELQEQIRMIDQMSIAEVALFNRRIFEAAFPNLMIKSMNETIVKGEWQMFNEIMTQRRGEEIVRMVMVTPEEREGPRPEFKPEYDGQTLTPSAFLEYIAVMVKELHTPEELERLPAVQSANPDEAFFFRNPLQPTQITNDLRIQEENLNELDAFENRLLQESGGNPVIKSQ